MQWFINLQIKYKLFFGFGTVVAIFLGLQIFQITELNKLKVLQDDGNSRAVDAQQLSEIEKNVLSIYSVAADAIINGNLAESHADMNKIKDSSESNKKAILELAETPAEKQEAEKFCAAIDKYLDGINNKLLASLDRGVQSGSEEIKAIDTELDGYRNACIAPLNELSNALVKKSARADEEYDSISASIKEVSIILILLACVVAAFIGVFIARVINEPVNKVMKMAQELAKGHVNARSSVSQNDEVGIMAKVVDQTAAQWEAFTGVMQKIADGDAAVLLEPADKDDLITPALNNIAATLRELIGEAQMLTQAAVEGNLATRGNAAKFKGGYREIVSGVNSTLDAVIEPINESTSVLAALAEGDLRVRMLGHYKGDHQKIKTSINNVALSLSDTIARVNEAVVATASSATEISSSTGQMAAGAQETSSQTAEIASAIEEMTKTIFETSKNTAIASEESALASRKAEEGTQRVSDTTRGMEQIVSATREAGGIISSLSQKTDQIGAITEVIDDIANQTNLLALNAAIEAARAGEQGRGFAVVADEVRKLAERTTKATKEIADTIRSVQKEAKDADASMTMADSAVTAGIELIRQVADSLKEILSVNAKVAGLVEQVAAASEEQSTTAEQISKNIDMISNVTNESAAGVGQVAKTAEDLSKLTLNLQELISQFKFDGAAETFQFKAGHAKQSKKLRK
jgi:methyl-accepting chemotaxis protein